MEKDIGKDNPRVTRASAKKPSCQYIRKQSRRFEHPHDVRFECVKCGICCGDTQQRTRHILLLDEEARCIAKTTNQPVHDIASKIEGKEPYVYELKKNPIDGKCIFLLENRCTIYSKRPLICRFYPFGLEASREQQPVFFFTNECPGIGRGTEMKENDFRKLLTQADKRIENWE